MALATSTKVPSLAQMQDHPQIETPAKVFSRGPGSKLTYGAVKAPRLKATVTSKQIGSRGSRLRKQL